MKIKVWELPVILFHWSLAAAFLAAWLTQSDRFLYYHVFAGYLFLALLIFRIYWSIKGEYYARLKSFLYSPSHTVTYLKHLLTKKSQYYIGHNPAGSWAIYIIVLLGLVIAITGLVTFGAEEQHGPLKGLFNFTTGHRFHELHMILADILMYLVIIHIAGVLIESLLHRENLIVTMLTGNKNISDKQAFSPVNNRTKTALLLLTLIILFSIYWLKDSALIKNETFKPIYTLEILPENALWQEECGSCHLAYFPAMLPQRSWEKLFSQQAEHFSEDLSLDSETIMPLKSYAHRYAGKTFSIEAFWKIQNSIRPGDTPIRITQTPYWKNKHLNIANDVWRLEQVVGKFNCEACHRDANHYWFDDTAIVLP